MSRESTEEPAPAAGPAEEATSNHPARVISEISYTEPVPTTTEGHLLDVYLPAVAAGDRLPALIWTSGSAWTGDDGKTGALPIAAEFTDRGYVVVGVSIRSSAQTEFPGQLHDIRAAIRFLRSNATTYFIDPDRLAIMGNSSGGWTAAMAATTSTMTQLVGEPDVGGVSSAVMAAVSFFPPIDFLAMDTQALEQMVTYGMEGDPLVLHDCPESPESLLVGGPIQECPDRAREASPLHYIDGAEPPMAIFHGTNDPLLPPGQSLALYRRLRDAGAVVNLTLVDGAGHEVMMPVPDGPPRPFDVGAPVIDGESYSMRCAAQGEEHLGVGVAPTWDSIAEFLARSLDH